MTMVLSTVLLLFTLTILSVTPTTHGYSLSMKSSPSSNKPFISRRFCLSTFGTAAMAIVQTQQNPSVANAATDCTKDCLKNCKLIAPKDPAYCEANCKSYCDQDDRTDGLSGSVSSEGGEVGILGTSTVVKGEDKPPSVKIPGLDFLGSEKGRKLIGY